LRVRVWWESQSEREIVARVRERESRVRVWREGDSESECGERERESVAQGLLD